MLSELLSPITPTEFFADYWERRPLILNRDTPDKFRALPTIGDIERSLATSGFRHPDVRLANPDNAPKTADYTLPDGRIDVLAVTKLFAGGVTMVFEQMHRKLPALRDLCRSLESELGIALQTNLYLSPPGAGGFKVHYDTHDVFVLQVEGSKDWELFESPIELPMRGQYHDQPGLAPGASAKRFRLSRGDLAYIPRGIYHAACAGKDRSLHITLGTLSKTWCELILEAISELSLRDVEMRRALPIGFGTGSFDPASARTHLFRLLDRAVASVDFDATVRSLQQEFIRTRDPDLREQLANLAQLGTLSPETPVRARANCIYSVEETESGVTLRYLNSVIDLPAHTAQSLADVLSGRTAKVSDISGPLDTESKLVLVRRLIEEGLVVRSA